MTMPDGVVKQLILADDDLVMARAPMPLRKNFFPMGFPIEVITNSSLRCSKRLQRAGQCGSNDLIILRSRCDSA